MAGFAGLKGFFLSWRFWWLESKKSQALRMNNRDFVCLRGSAIFTGRLGRESSFISHISQKARDMGHPDLLRVQL
jgi:hypothetical protein